MSRFLFALGQSSFRHRWWVLGAWLAVLIAVAAGFLGFRGQPSDNFTIPGTESQRAGEQLQQNLPAFSGAQTQLTFVAPEGRAITDPALTPDALLLPAAEAALHGGARLLQYREKTATADQRRRRDGAGQESL